MRKMFLSVCVVSLILVLTACSKKDADVVDTTEEKTAFEDREDDAVSDKEEYAETDDNYETEEYQDESDDVEYIDEDNAEEKQEPKHFDAMSEVINASFNDGMLQVGDLLIEFNKSEEDGHILSALENSELDFLYKKAFDKNGNIIPEFEVSGFIIEFDNDIFVDNVIIETEKVQDILNLSLDSIYLAHGFQVYGDNTMDDLLALLEQDGINEYPKEGLSIGEADIIEKEGYYRIMYEGSYQKVCISSCNGELYTVVFDMDGRNVTREYQEDMSKDLYEIGKKTQYFGSHYPLH